MRTRDDRHTASSALAEERSDRVESEGMLRWENEGGAIRHSAGQRPRPLP